jgi:hypothetical protein
LRHWWKENCLNGDESGLDPWKVDIQKITAELELAFPYIPDEDEDEVKEDRPWFEGSCVLSW